MCNPARVLFSGLNNLLNRSANSLTASSPAVLALVVVLALEVVLALVIVLALALALALVIVLALALVPALVIVLALVPVLAPVRSPRSPLGSSPSRCTPGSRFS